MILSKKSGIIAGIVGLLIVIESVILVYLSLHKSGGRAVPELTHPNGAAQIALDQYALTSDEKYLTFTGVLQSLSSDKSHVYAQLDVYGESNHTSNRFALLFDPSDKLQVNQQITNDLFPISKYVKKNTLISTKSMLPLNRLLEEWFLSR